MPLLHKYIILLRYIGLWPEGNKYFQNSKYTYFSVIMISSFMVLDYICTVLDIPSKWNNIERLANLLTILAEKTITIMEAVLFLRNVKIRNEILETFDLDIMKPKNDKQRTIVKNSLKMFTYISSVYFSSCSITLICLFLLPIVKREREFPFDAWYPFSAYTSPWFELIYAHQCIAATWNHFAHLAVEIFCAGLMATIGSQCDLLSDKVINGEVADGTNFEENGVSSNDGMATVIRHVHFKKIVKHHQEILRVSDQVNDLFSFLVFVELTLVILLLCTALFRLSIVENGGFESFLFLGYFVSMSQQLFLYCWFGAEVHEKSLNLHSATFQSRWIDASLKVKKNLLFLMKRTNNPIKMYALYFFPLSTATFTSVMRSSWSFFVLLRNMNE